MRRYKIEVKPDITTYMHKGSFAGARHAHDKQHDGSILTHRCDLLLGRDIEGFQLLFCFVDFHSVILSTRGHTSLHLLLLAHHFDHFLVKLLEIVYEI